MFSFKTRNRKSCLLLKPEVFSQSFWLMKLINKVMFEGKKARVEKIFLICFYEFRHNYVTTQPFLILFRYLLIHRPLFGFSRVRLSRIFKRIPVPLSPKRQLIFIITWFVWALREINGGNLKQKLYKELKLIRSEQKTALMQYKLVQEFYFQVVSNTVNVRFRWK